MDNYGTSNSCTNDHYVFLLLEKRKVLSKPRQKQISLIHAYGHDKKQD